MSPILIVTVAISVIVAAILVYREYRKRRPNCPYHHYGDYSFKRNIEVETESLNPIGHRHDFRVRVKQERVAKCQHEGCEATKSRWRTIEAWEGNTN